MLSIPVKYTSSTSKIEVPWYEPRHYSFRFSNIGQFDQNDVTNILVKHIIRNMQWNKYKKVINASDQTTNDNPNTQQK